MVHRPPIGSYLPRTESTRQSLRGVVVFWLGTVSNGCKRRSRAFHPLFLIPPSLHIQIPSTSKSTSNVHPHQRSILWSHGQSCSRAQCNTSRCPPATARAHVAASTGSRAPAPTSTTAGALPRQRSCTSSHPTGSRAAPTGRVTRCPISISRMTISILSSPISLAHIPYRYPG